MNDPTSGTTVGQAKHRIPQAEGLRHPRRCRRIAGKRFGIWRGAAGPGCPGTHPTPPAAATSALSAGAEAVAAACAQACPERREDFAGEEQSSEGIAEIAGLEVAAGPGGCRGVLVQEEGWQRLGTVQLRGAAEQGVPEAVGEGRGHRLRFPTRLVHQLLRHLPLGPSCLLGALPAEPDHPDALATRTALVAEVLKAPQG